MFTLKIASGTTRMWFADVAQVSLISQESVPTDVLASEVALNAVKGERSEPWGNYGAAWYVDFEDRPAKLLSLLWIVFGEPGHRGQSPDVKETYLVTEYAWLLASNGDTIERICP